MEKRGGHCSSSSTDKIKKNTNTVVPLQRGPHHPACLPHVAPKRHADAAKEAARNTAKAEEEGVVASLARRLPRFRSLTATNSSSSSSTRSVASPRSGTHDGEHGGAAAASAGGGESGGPGRAGVLAGVLGGHAEAGGGDGGGGDGGGAELHAAAGARGRDAVRHGAGVPPALRHRLRPPVHLHPEERRLDPPRLPLHGHRRRLHRGAARPPRPAGEAHRRRLHPRRHLRHHGPPRGAPGVPVHAAVHHPGGRDDGRERDDGDRGDDEEAEGGRGDAARGGGDGAGAGRDAAAGDGAAGEEVAGDRAVAGDRQRQDGGADRAAGRHDRPHHGRRVAAGGHPAADRGDEHAHGRFHRQQHPLHLPLLAGLLHRRLPAQRRRLRRRLIFPLPQHLAF